MDETRANVRGTTPCRAAAQIFFSRESDTVLLSDGSEALLARGFFLRVALETLPRHVDVIAAFMNA